MCTGNICRSPMGEVVLREAFGAAALPVVVASAGVSAEEQGNPIDPRARAVLERAGYPIHDHRAHRVRPGELAQYDLVLAMTSHHLHALRRRADLDGIDHDRLHMWREFDPAAPHLPHSTLLRDPSRLRDLDIQDPWYGGHRDFVETLSALEAGAQGIVTHMRVLLGD